MTLVNVAILSLTYYATDKNITIDESVVVYYADDIPYCILNSITTNYITFDHTYIRFIYASFFF